MNKLNRVIALSMSMSISAAVLADGGDHIDGHYLAWYPDSITPDPSAPFDRTLPLRPEIETDIVYGIGAGAPSPFELPAFAFDDRNELDTDMMYGRRSINRHRDPGWSRRMAGKSPVSTGDI